MQNQSIKQELFASAELVALLCPLSFFAAGRSQQAICKNASCIIYLCTSCREYDGRGQAGNNLQRDMFENARVRSSETNHHFGASLALHALTADVTCSPVSCRRSPGSLQRSRKAIMTLRRVA